MMNEAERVSMAQAVKTLRENLPAAIELQQIDAGPIRSRPLPPPAPPMMVHFGWPPPTRTPAMPPVIPPLSVTGEITAYFDGSKMLAEWRAGEEALQKAIKEVYLSPWFPGPQRPWEPGMYERIHEYGNIIRDYWTGYLWWHVPIGKVPTAPQDLPWRGLAADPRADGKDSDGKAGRSGK